MESVAEAIAVEGRINGQQVIDDLCNRIAMQLGHSCDLRLVDNYASYSARVQVQLQLHDVDRTEAAAEIAVGAIDAGEMVRHIAADIPVITPEEVLEKLGPGLVDTLERCVDGSIPEPVAVRQPSLERCADGSEVEPPPTTAAVPGKRFYTPRGAVPVGTRAPK